MIAKIYNYWYICFVDVQQQRCISQWEAHTGEIRSVQYNSDFTSFYSVGADNKVGYIVRYMGRHFWHLEVSDYKMYAHCNAL